MEDPEILYLDDILDFNNFYGTFDDVIKKHNDINLKIFGAKFWFCYDLYICHDWLNGWELTKRWVEGCYNHSQANGAPQVLYGQKQSSKGVLKICSKFENTHCEVDFNKVPLLRNFIKVALQHKCSPTELLHIFRTPFPKNIFKRLLL